MHRFLSLFAIFAVLTFAFLNTATTQSFAQSSMVKSLESATDSTSPTSLPNPLTRQAIRDVLSGLSDAQARELLVKELDKQVAKAEKARQKPQLSMFGVLENWGTLQGKHWAKAISTIPDIPTELSRIYSDIVSKRNDRNLWAVPATLIISLFGAAIIAFIFNSLTKTRREAIVNKKPTDLWGQVVIVGVRFILQTIQLSSFVVAAFIINAIINRGEPIDHSIVKFIIGAISWTLFALISARFVLSPRRPDLRLCSIDDHHAKFLNRRIWIIFGFSAFFIDILFWLYNQHDWLDENAQLGLWISLAFYMLVAQTFWQGRKGIVQLVLGHEDNPSPTLKKFAEFWPMIAMALVMLQWFVLGLMIATGNGTSISQTAMMFSLVVIVMAPIFRLIVQAVVKAAWPIDEAAEPKLQAAQLQTQAGLIRFARIVLGAVIIILFAKAWNIDLQNLASKGVGNQIAGAIVEIFLTGVFAYGLWEFLNILSDRQIALDKAEFGSSDEAEGHGGDGPGGMGGSRLGTLMPLIHGAGKVVIFIMATLAILGQMGVNVTPLLAGAGIIGMAVAFGAQTLVKDIFSGIFFLVDDAFRKGEYLDVGSVRGTVEKISVRSMQLRHHNGPLNTVPFGSIDQLTNYSRDWAIMKLSLRLTYDTDADKVRKMIKKLGQRLLEHPEFGPLFVEPLKSQGVRSMEDSAMIMRIKFTTKPGDQFTLRRFVLDEVRKLFDANGIKFANREVTVHLAETSEKEKDNLTAAQKLAIAAAAATAVQADDEAAAPSATPATEGI